MAAGLADGARGEEAEDSIWYRYGAEGQPEILLYFFWSESCLHCSRARAFLEGHDARPAWLRVRSFEVTGSAENRRLFAALAAALEQEILGVPTFFLCGRMLAGFDDAEGQGAALIALAQACRAELEAERAGPAPAADPAPAPQEPETLELPLVGRVAVTRISLPFLTLLLGGLDAFNPCAFFVLLFLLSLLVHARSRGRMLLVGGLFVLISGLFYFLFMAAWLNLFLILEGVRIVTMAAGLVAVALALVNVKEFFLFKRGPSLTIPETAKPGLFQRMRRLISAERLPALLGGTAALAAAANTYELLCTSGFPLVYTRALTLRELPSSTYYLYLALYNVVYVLPLLAIVIAVTFVLGARKLSEAQGRVLKLLSGLMMLGLGLVLVIAPSLLDNALTAVGLLLVALLATALLYRWDRGRADGGRGRRGP